MDSSTLEETQLVALVEKMRENYMQLRRARILAVITILLGSSLLKVSAKGEVEPTITQQISKTVADVKTGKSSRDRTDAAENLFEITQRNGSDQVGDQQLSEIIALLKNSDDSVRSWVARCLGNFGSRAKPAVPELLKILHEVDCKNASKTSASNIRFALKQIGVEPPRSQCNWRRILR